MRVYQVALEDLRFFSYHGLFPEEKILGNWYTLTVTLSKDVELGFHDQLANTVDYGELYAICKRHMSVPVDLLETICERVAFDMREFCPNFIKIEIKLSKLNPPLGLQGGRSTVSWIETNEA